MTLQRFHDAQSGHGEFGCRVRFEEAFSQLQKG